MAGAELCIAMRELRRCAYLGDTLPAHRFPRMTELLFRDDPYRRACDTTVTAVDGRGIRLAHTVFYPAGGGQPGDTGALRLADGSTVAIVDTQKGEGPDEVIHVPAAGAAVPPPGAAVTAEIDWERRHCHMRFHTCLHLLCAAVPYPVTGGRIAADKSHLDFDLQGAPVDKEAIEAKLNALIRAGHRVAPRWITDAELAASPELVRTMSVAPPAGQGRVRLLEIDGVDLQACGGTHVASTAEIGPVVVLKIRSEGKRNKRVTIGFAGEAADA
jgi:misacylated tRNA(Ala) deacylase